MSSICPLCRFDRPIAFFELLDMPVSIGVQWPSAEDARSCARGDLRIDLCSRCGFIWNRSFDPSRIEYSQLYDNSLDFSPLFREYARDLVRRLIETYGIREKDVVELGCGKGQFLSLLCEAGNNRGVGFDPSYEGARVPSSAADRITYFQDFYGEKYTSHRADLICCRHVFEHIADPAAFLGTVRRTIGDRESAIVYFEVPNVRFILDKLSIWDIIYEHCNYFGRESLSYVFRSCGFDVLCLADAYDGQFLSLEARLSTRGDQPEVSWEDTSELAVATQRFADRVRARAELWHARLNQIGRDKERAAIWGGGAKAVSFLNMLKIGDTIPYVVDINPHKQGRHIAGTGQKIVPPSFLTEYKPHKVILMNPIYRNEVEGTLRELEVSAELIEA